MDNFIALNPNAVVAFLQKRPQDFTRADLLRFISENGIRWSISCIRPRTAASRP